MKSGFLGVDVFFVISGFVVTSSIVSSEHNRLSRLFVEFIAKRVKRLLPALGFCVAIVGFATILFDPYPRASIETGIYSLFGLSNFALYRDAFDYFAASSKFNAFTHTWSLGVEEQFYLLFPFLIWFALLTNDKRGYSLLLTWVCIISTLSLVTFLSLYQVNTPAAYFLMPARLWELGLGVVLFIWSEKRANEDSASVDCSVLKVASLIALIFCFALPESSAPYSNLAAVALTGLILVCPSGPTLFRSVLENRPLVYIGKASYSLYLWHWPVIALAPMISIGLRNDGIYILATAIFSLISYRLIERPLRNAKWGKTPSQTIVLALFGVTLIALALIIATTLSRKSVDQSTFAVYPKANVPLRQTHKPYNPTCVVDGQQRRLQLDTFQLCTLTKRSPGNIPTIWSLGDSHVGHLQSLLYELHDTLGVGIFLVETVGRVFPTDGTENPDGRNVVYQHAIENLESGDILLLSRSYFGWDMKPRQKLEQWFLRVEDLAKELNQLGIEIVLVAPLPVFAFKDVRECEVGNIQDCAVDRNSQTAMIEPVLNRLRKIKALNSNVHLYDPFAILCPHSVDYCPASKDGAFLYRDRSHLNTWGASQLTPSFVEFARSEGLLDHAGTR